MDLPVALLPTTAIGCPSGPEKKAAMDGSIDKPVRAYPGTNGTLSPVSWSTTCKLVSTCRVKEQTRETFRARERESRGHARCPWQGHWVAQINERDTTSSL